MQSDLSRLHCAATARSGNPCKGQVVFGATVCRMHGGSAPQVRRKAAERLLNLGRQLTEEEAAFVTAVSRSRYIHRRRSFEVTPGWTIVYQFFGNDDRLLYVGITSDPERRIHEHKRSRPWFADVRRATFEHFESRLSAEARESELVTALNPPFNEAIPRTR